MRALCVLSVRPIMRELPFAAIAVEHRVLYSYSAVGVGGTSGGRCRLDPTDVTTQQLP